MESETIEYQVWHVANPTYNIGMLLGLPEFMHVCWPRDYEHVANVLATGLEDVFEMTQDSWSDNDNVFCRVKTHRSTSVGDVVITPKGEIRRCESDGWSLIDWVV